MQNEKFKNAKTEQRENLKDIKTNHMQVLDLDEQENFSDTLNDILTQKKNEVMENTI